MATKEQIVLYHYSFSPYARRIIWYLALRGMEYVEVKQPPIMPRPDLEAIGVKYRRIPIMAIGKDVYCDTRLILEKLEKLYPDGAIGATNEDQKALEKLLEIWHIEANVFARASQLIPSDMPLLKDPKFAKDREQFSGRSWSQESIEQNRPEAIAHVRLVFTLLETTLLADGREWILKTAEPTLADIQAVWVVDWLNGLKGALPRDLISEKSHPKVFAYIKRFNQALKTAKSKAPKPVAWKGNQAAEHILHANYAESATGVDELDPLGLSSGMEVEVRPIDSGFSHTDSGSLVALNEDEVVIKLQNDIRLHSPRCGFRIKKVNPSHSRL